MKPDARKDWSTGSAAALRNFSLVVREDVVFAAGMDVDLVAEQHACHRTALDVPAGVTLTPR